MEYRLAKICDIDDVLALIKAAIVQMCIVLQRVVVALHCVGMS